ncbi:hypothetical protein BKA69DRAFT_1039313 [Paraphysoderma sedebokerense]|nr:hypothetical protein BKA69DRAFT_1039313 [Paraphysoderma sedebokerense]
MSVLNYLLLFITFTMYWIVTRPKKFLQVMKRCWKVYAIMSFFDFEATYCLNKAFGLTSSLSATVLLLTDIMPQNSSTVPFTVCLSYVFLKTRYRWKHYMSILLCLGGMGILVFEDLRQNRISNDVSPFANIPLGDALALFAGFSYSVAAISQEYAIKSFGSPAEYCVFLLLFKQFSFTPIYYCAFAVIIASLVVFNWNPEDLKTLFTERAEERKTQEKSITDIGEKCDLAKSESIELNAVKYM